MKTKVKRAFQILSVIFLFMFLLVACKGIDHKEQIISQAEETMDSALRKESFKKLNENEKIKKIEEMLAEFAKDGAIEEQTIDYDETEQLFMFEYSDGTLGGISLKDFNDELNTNSGISDNQKQNNEKNSKSGTLNALVLNGFENKPKRREFYEELEKDWENQGLITTVDTDVTIDDLKGFNNYEVIILAMHGAVYKGEPVLSLNQVVTKETDDKYEQELDNQLVAKVYCNDYQYHYWVKDDFFSTLYKKINSRLIFSETCQFYGCDSYNGVDTSFADTLVELSTDTVIGYHNSVEMYYSRNVMKETVDNLLSGNVAKDSLQKAIDTYGENDDWEDVSEGKYKAYPILTGNKNMRLTEIQVSDFNIPEDLVITLGELGIIEQKVEPENASDYQIKWTSSDESVATVTKTGEACVITSHSKGSTTITATLTSGGKTITKSTKLRVASKGRDTVLVLDISGSMSGTPMTEMKEAAIDFCHELLQDEYNNRVGIVFYDDEITTVPLTNDLNSLVSQIEQVQDGGMTNMEGAIASAKTMLEQQGKKDSIKNIVVMADGLPNDGKTSSSGSMKTTVTTSSLQLAYANAVIDTAEGAMQSYNMYSLGFFHDLYGDSLEFASDLMRKLTNQPDGYHQVVEAENLQFAFGDISEEISDGSKVVINIACPVDVTVTYNGETLSSAKSTYNDKTSFGTLQLLGAEKDIKVLTLEDGVVYDVNLAGTGEGKMNYSVNFLDEKENLVDSREFVAVPLTSQTKITSSTDVETENMDLNIDEDGDGVVDTIWSASKNQTGSVTYEKESEQDEKEQKTVETIKEIEPKETHQGIETWQIALISVGVLAFVGIVVAIVLVCVSTSKTDEIEIDDEKPEHEERTTEEQAVVCGPSVAILNGPLAGAEIPLRDKETIYVGKDTKLANIVFTGDYPNVSRLHCSIMYDAKHQKYFVTDSSANGTYYLNNLKLEKGKRTAVQPGTTLILANENAKIMLR